MAGTVADPTDADCVDPVRQCPPVRRDFFMAGTYVIIVGAIVSLATVTTGFWDWWKGIDREPTGPVGRPKHPQVWRTMNTHMTMSGT